VPSRLLVGEDVLFSVLHSDGSRHVSFLWRRRPRPASDLLHEFSHDEVFELLFDDLLGLAALIKDWNLDSLELVLLALKHRVSLNFGTEVLEMQDLLFLELPFAPLHFGLNFALSFLKLQLDLLFKICLVS